jgi:hypothetical protein
MVPDWVGIGESLEKLKILFRARAGSVTNG